MRGDHPGGERARVERVLCVQDHRHVERVHHDQLGNIAERHVQEVGRVRQVVPRLDQVLVAAAALVPRDHGRQLREQADGLLQVRLGHVRVRIGSTERAHRGADDIHRMRGQRHLVDHPFHQRVELTLRPLLSLELIQLLRRRQLTVPEQVGDLLERALLGEFLHRVSAVEQGVRVRIHLGHGRDVDHDAGEPLLDLGRRDLAGRHVGLVVGGHSFTPGTSKSNTEVSKVL